MPKSRKQSNSNLPSNVTRSNRSKTLIHKSHLPPRVTRATSIRELPYSHPPPPPRVTRATSIRELPYSHPPPPPRVTHATNISELPYSHPPPPPRVTRATSISELPYSTMSDHKPVYLKFKLTNINASIIFKAFSYNMSYLSDLGPKSPWEKGSEAYFLSRIIGNDKRLYWKNAANLVHDFFSTEDPDVMFFQEMNVRNRIITKDPDEVTLENGEFMGGYEALLELLNGGPIGIVYSNEFRAFPKGSKSYYVHGSFKVKDKDKDKAYCFLAYSIEKDGTFPTVLTIWKTLHLGEFKNFYGNDIGFHSLYKPSEPGTVNKHLGRNFSCVRTTNNANLINFHGPNARNYTVTKLKVVIEEYMTEAEKKFGNTWKEKSTIIGGDSNDANNSLHAIRLNNERYTYNYEKPLTCCAEKEENTLDNYPYTGDILFVARPRDPIEIYEPQILVSAHGYNNKKKRKSLKRKQVKRHTYKHYKQL